MTQSRAALAGVRVIDLTSGPAGGLATMILADFGAQVLRVVHPQKTDPMETLAAAPMWRRGKAVTQLDLDLATDRATFSQLCAGADVLVSNWRTTAMAARSLDWPTLHEQHPHLHLCQISGFGSHGPMAGVAGYEHAVAAYSGRMRNFAGIVDRPGPVFSALQVGMHACAQNAATAILSLLLQAGGPADQAGKGYGRLVETSVLQGMLPYEQGPMLGMQFPDRFPSLPALQADSHQPPMPSLFYHPAQAGDGRWMQFGNLLPHLFDNFLIVTGLIDIVADPDFDAKQLRLPADKQEVFRERMLSRIQERSADEWMQDVIADGGVVGTTYQTTQQALADPDIVANGHVLVEAPDIRQLGPVAQLSVTPAQPGVLPVTPARQAEALERGDELSTLWQAQPRPQPEHDHTGTAPLAGVRVIELATIIAAPMGASLLADLGAEVIKVEQIGGDPYRSMGGGIGSARVNAGKRSLCVDLKSAAGREVVLALIGTADVVIHNFRPGVPERLGIGYEQVAALNPQIVYLQSNGYGTAGPGAQRPSTHPIPGAAMGGVMFQMGERLPSVLQDFNALRQWTRRLMRANEVNPDPNTALVVATSVMLGLVARQRAGCGQQIFVDMFGANAYANHDDFLDYPDKPPRPLPDETLAGTSPLYQLYPCADDQWVFLAIPQAAEQAQFCRVVEEAGVTPPPLGALAAANKTTVDVLTELFAGRNATAWQALFAPAGIACVRADGDLPSDFWRYDPQAQALELTAPVKHPDWGDYQRHGPMLHFDGSTRSPEPLQGPPLAGQHNLELALEAGHTQAQAASLAADNVLWQAELP
ncbi:MAG: CoA transferase [Pseudomonadota bacterium]